MSKLTVGMFTLLIVAAVQLAVVTASPYSQSDYFALKTAGLQHQVEALKAMQQIKVKEKCFNVTGDNDAYKDLELAQATLQSCIKLTINEALLESVQSQSYNQLYYYSASQQEDSVVNMLKAICLKKQTIKRCQENYFEVAKKCMDANAKKKLQKAAERIEELGNYVCYNDAERITSFVDNGGIKCFNMNLDSIRQCVFDLSDDVRSLIDPTALGTSDIDEAKSCKASTTFFNCMVDKLKTCNNQTPANIVEGAFKHLLEITECETKTAKE